MRFTVVGVALIGYVDGFLQPKLPNKMPHQRQGNRPIFIDRNRFRACNPLDMSIIASNAELQPGIDSIDSANPNLYQALSYLRDDPYFRLYSVDILASCEYIPQELFECYSETCEIYPVDEEEVPIALKSVDASEFGFDIDGWARWDMPTEDYYDTTAFPEGYTGYDGREVWEFIHNRICFEGFQYDDDHWKADFNKAVSGLHSMISAQVNRGIQERVELGEPFTDDEVWRDPDAEFQRRLSPQGETPLAMENLYFAFMLILKAVSKVQSLLLNDVNNGRISADSVPLLQAILNDPILNDDSVGVAFKKLHDHAVMDVDSKAALWEARMRTRELVRIMNCVQCNKCRLHGKISTMGLSTALQILVGEDGEGGDISSLHRVELATLMATMHKFSTAVDFCQQKLRY